VVSLLGDHRPFLKYYNFRCLYEPHSSKLSSVTIQQCALDWVQATGRFLRNPRTCGLFCYVLTKIRRHSHSSFEGQYGTDIFFLIPAQTFLFWKFRVTPFHGFWLMLHVGCGYVCHYGTISLTVITIWLSVHRSQNIYTNLYLFIIPTEAKVFVSRKHAVEILVEALYYKPEGRVLDSWWGHWIFQLT
jgi:hypothetical protein